MEGGFLNAREDQVEISPFHVFTTSIGGGVLPHVMADPRVG
jgi:hypothetical protein